MKEVPVALDFLLLCIFSKFLLESFNAKFKSHRGTAVHCHFELEVEATGFLLTELRHKYSSKPLISWGSGLTSKAAKET